MIFPSCLIVAALLIANPVSALSSTKETGTFSRRGALGWFAIGIAVPAFAEEERTDIRAEGMDINNFMKTGTVSQPKGVSGQAGKSRPETGVILRQGSDVSRNEKSGDVLAEIVVKGVGKEPIMAVLASYVSPWPLAGKRVTIESWIFHLVPSRKRLSQKFHARQGWLQPFRMVLVKQSC